MRTHLIISVLTAIILGLVIKDTPALEMFGYTFDDDAFSDNASYVSGNVTYWGFSKWGYVITGDHDVDLDTALNGSDLYTGISGEKIDEKMYNYTIDVEFLDNYLYNGEGPDLIIWERGTQERIHISLYNPQIGDWTAQLGFNPFYVGSVPGSVDIAGTVNATEVDFSLWNIDQNIHISKIRVSTEHYTGNSWICADISAFGGLNSDPIPEPSTILLLTTGLGGMTAYCFRRKKKM